MDKKKEISPIIVILNTICALVWNINLFIDLAHGAANPVSFALRLICAIAWDFCALVWIVRYLKSKKNK